MLADVAATGKELKGTGARAHSSEDKDEAATGKELKVRSHDLDPDQADYIAATGKELKETECVDCRQRGLRLVQQLGKN